MNRNHPLQNIIVHCLQRRPMTVRELADTTSSDEHVIRASLSALCDRGEVRQNGRSAGKRPKQLFELCHALNAQEGV